MNRKLITSTLAIVALCLATTAFATPRVNARQHRQHARIHQGVANGQLTRGEAMRLRTGQRHVNRLERRANADGTMNRRERARLEWAQDRQSGRIHRLKHNARSRGC